MMHLWHHYLIRYLCMPCILGVEATFRDLVMVLQSFQLHNYICETISIHITCGSCCDKCTNTCLDNFAVERINYSLVLRFCIV